MLTQKIWAIFEKIHRSSRRDTDHTNIIGILQTLSDVPPRAPESATHGKRAFLILAQQLKASAAASNLHTSNQAHSYSKKTSKTHYTRITNITTAIAILLFAFMGIVPNAIAAFWGTSNTSSQIWRSLSFTWRTESPDTHTNTVPFYIFPYDYPSTAYPQSHELTAAFQQQISRYLQFNPLLNNNTRNQSFSDTASQSDHNKNKPLAKPQVQTVTIPAPNHTDNLPTNARPSNQSENIPTDKGQSNSPPDCSSAPPPSTLPDTPNKPQTMLQPNTDPLTFFDKFNGQNNTNRNSNNNHH